MDRETGGSYEERMESAQQGEIVQFPREAWQEEIDETEQAKIIEEIFFLVEKIGQLEEEIVLMKEALITSVPSSLETDKPRSVLYRMAQRAAYRFLATDEDRVTREERLARKKQRENYEPLTEEQKAEIREVIKQLTKELSLTRNRLREIEDSHLTSTGVKTVARLAVESNSHRISERKSLLTDTAILREATELGKQGESAREQLAELLDCEPSEISFNQKEALRGNIIFHCGDLDLDSLTSAEGLTLPASIGGGLDLRSLTSAERNRLREKYPNLHIIGG